MNVRRLLGTAVSLFFFAITTFAGAFTPGNLVIYPLGDGTAALASPRTIPLDGTTATGISTTNTNTRQIAVFNVQLYISSGASTIRLATIGSRTPTTSGQTMTSLPGLPITVTLNSFFFADLDGSPGL